jgi:hypothetical protein
MSNVFTIHLDNLTEWVKAQGNTSSSEVIQSAIATAMAQDTLPAIPVEQKKAGVRLDTEARQWLQAQVKQWGLDAEAEAGRACLAAQAIGRLVSLAELYKQDEIENSTLTQALWSALGYTPTNGSPAGTASSQVDKGDP